MPLTSNEVKSLLFKLGVEAWAERGDEITALCPGHELRTGVVDNNPSWSINTESGVHHCFSCGYKGNVLTLIAEQKEFKTEWGRLDVDAAKNWLRENSQIDLDLIVKEMEEVKYSYIAIPKPVEMSEARLAVYTSQIPVWALNARGLTAGACRMFTVRWDTQNEAWILPIRDYETGKLIGWQEKGQVIRHFKNRPTGVLKSSTVFNSGSYPQPESFIVVESPLDAVRLQSLGIPNAVATFGASVSPAQLNIIRSNAESIVFAFDNDTAGQAASLRMLDLSRKTGFECKFFNYGDSEAKDVGDMSEDAIRYGIETAKHCVLGKAAILG